MLKFVKKYCPLIIIVLTLFILASCGGAADDVPVNDITQKIDSAIGDDGEMISVDEGYIEGSMKMDVSAFSEYTVKINGYGVNIDEYGVFKGADKNEAKEIENAVNSYLQMRVETWMTEYMPEEFPKLQEAEVETVGNYVMYAILSDEDKAAAFSAFEDCLK